MAYQEKSLTCSDCGKSFPFTPEEQEFFAPKSFTSEPGHCPACRSDGRVERFGTCGSKGGSYSNLGLHRMFPAACARSGQQTEVPFQPRGDKPVYCRDCFTMSR
jgi:CxxC-x17-CxxC domain-containing protein